ncbi:ATP-dependent RNA helicase vasa-like [Panonychus citri]|uniref:ATP-dependent RNA helicase vasa-like n=1 Tax=Panonychus citri TaxID=50023 RepID=UPI00230744A0|nr:ATP-dependent RNA helicase vasa-like [Panonychus citri]
MSDDFGSAGGWGDSGNSGKKSDLTSSGAGSSWGNGVTSGSSAKTSSGDNWGSGDDSWGNSGGSSKKSGGNDAGSSWGASGGASGGDSWGASEVESSDKPKGKGCFKCGEEGHMSRECPSGGAGGGNRGKGCFKCGEEGHMSRECPSGGGGGGDRGKGCFKCGEEGHMSRECPSGGGGGSRGKGCFKCGEEGHMSRECPSGGGSSGSRDCPTGVNEDGSTPDARPPIYVPPELNKDDKSLYESIATGENFDRYDSIPCSVTGDDKPTDPERYETFEEAFTSTTIRAGLAATKISKPMPIQKYGMRIVMAKRDLMACAQTGSGKTLAFMLPILQDLFSDPDTTSGYGSGCQEPKAVVVTPTRELAIQIYREAYKYSADSIVKVQIIYGGTSSSHQRAKLSEGCHVLVGTPGRIIDFLDKGYFSFSSLKYFVLDEADRMIDQGFIPDIRRMASHPTMPPVSKRQTLMFSATFPDEVQRVAAEFLKKDYLFLTVGILGAANSDVEQTFFKVDKTEKRNKIIEVLGSKENNDRTMIFVEAKKTADFLASFLSQKGYKATSIHGDRFQHQREEALRDLKSGKYPLLVATSVASRGLDIQGVLHVINYDLPKEIDDYVHRIGRTGRVGNKGRSTSFYDPSFDRPLAEKIVPIIEKASQSVPEWLKDEAGGGSPDYDDGFGGVDLRKLSDNFASSTTVNEENWD